MQEIPHQYISEPQPAADQDLAGRLKADLDRAQEAAQMFRKQEAESAHLAGAAERCIKALATALDVLEPKVQPMDIDSSRVAQSVGAYGETTARY